MANFDFAYNLDGSNSTPVKKKFPVAATQTLLVGDLVELSSGKIAKCGDATPRVFGVMAEDSSSAAAGTLVQVYVAQPGQVWRAIADADATTHVLAGRAYDINVTTQTVDVGDAAAGCIQIVELGSANTDVYVAFTAFELA